MTLSRIEAGWISSKLLSDAVLQREQSAARRTAWLVLLFSPLKYIRPTERRILLRRARARAAHDPLTLLATLLTIALATVFLVLAPACSYRVLFGVLATLTGLGTVVRSHVQIRALIWAAARRNEDATEDGDSQNK